MQFFHTTDSIREIAVEIDTTNVQPCTHYLFDRSVGKFPDALEDLFFFAGSFVFGQKIDRIIEVTGIHTRCSTPRKFSFYLVAKFHHSFTEAVKQTVEYLYH